MSDGLNINLRSDIDPSDKGGPSSPLGRVGAWVWDLVASWGPAILIVLVIRSILVEPFQIPSGSMVPTLEIGDFILVSKFTYGLRVPFTHIEILPLGEPERGDIIVFVYPPTQDTDPTDYIKRVVGLPGDEIKVVHNIVYVNGKEQERTSTGSAPYTDQTCRTESMNAFVENLDGHPHPVLQAEGFQRTADYGPVVVPPEHYFVMGDNRDNSADGRVWGFVPRLNIKGKANFVWLSFDRCQGNIPALGSLRTSRIGTVLQ